MVAAHDRSRCRISDDAAVLRVMSNETAPKTVSFLTKLMVEAERESVRELVNLVERLSSRDSRDSMTRYQELSALMEVSAILSRMSNETAESLRGTF